jgi:hypothetical protein
MRCADAKEERDRNRTVRALKPLRSTLGHCACAASVWERLYEREKNCNSQRPLCSDACLIGRASPRDNRNSRIEVE